MSNQDLKVTSNVGRDLLQSAALFKTDKLVVWEYVSNALQYVDVGVAPKVKVTLDSARKRMTIQDNGRGMEWSDLNNFFVMHGENLDRKMGRGGRGRFGTGKSAAFGIADTLRVTPLWTADGTSVGNWVGKDYQAWGFGSFLRRRGGEPGDIMLLVFDITKRRATIALGDETLLEELEGGVEE